MTADQIHIAVARHKRVVGVDAKDDDWRIPAGQPGNTRLGGAHAAFEVLPLADALLRAYKSDAHLATYTVSNGAPLDRQPRVTKAGLPWVKGEGYSLTSSALFADVDNPGHGDWTPELRAAFDEQWRTLPVLQTCGVYLTSHGYRLVQPLPHPVAVPEIELYQAAWLAELRAAGIAGVDLGCRDWTRLYRLPNVVRDGTPYRSPLVDFSRMEPRAIEPIAEEQAPERKAAPPVDGELAAGQRRPTLMSLAGSMRRRGMSAEEILPALRVANERRCRPMLADRELVQIADNVSKYEPAAPVEPERPIIKINTDLAGMVDAAIASLQGCGDLYQRDGRLVRVVRVAKDEATARVLEGTPQIRELPAATLTETLAARASWVRFDRRDEELRPALPPSQVVACVAARAQWRTVCPVRGVIETPIIRPDGVIVSEPGYDGVTGYFFAPTCDFPPVPDAPTQDEASRALAELAEVWCDFPFASDCQRYVPIAATLTLLGRPAIEGPTPAFVLDASTPGEGKTLSGDAAVAIATGRPAGKATFPPSGEELEKLLSSAAMAGESVVDFDNLEQEAALGGAALDKALTAWPTITMRVLGQSDLRTLAWNAVIIATGNNVEIHGDTVRRALVARIESGTESPEGRTGFRHPDLLRWVSAERPRLVSAGLTILRGYVAAGRPDMGLGTMGTFEAWAGLIANAIAWAGGANVLDARAASIGREDPAKSALRTIIAGLPRVSAEPITTRNLLGALYSSERLRGQACEPDGHDELREALESLAPTRPGQMPDAQRLGKALQRLRRRVVGGRMLDTVTVRNVAGWVVS